MQQHMRDGEVSCSRRRILIGAMFVVIAALRFYNMELISTTNDEGAHGRLAMFVALFDVEQWPLAGLPSVGIRNSALFIYLIAVAEFVYWHPLSGAYLVVALNVWAVYLAYRLATERFGTAAGVVVLVLYGFSPWAVLYARNMWPPSCLAVVCLWFISMCLRWLDQGGRGRLFGMVVLAFIIPQVHFSGVCAPLWLLAVLFAGRKQLGWLPLLGGIAVGLATWTPWIIFQQVTEWIDLRSVGAVAKGKDPFSHTLFNIGNYLQHLLHSGGFEFWFGRSPADLPEYFPVWARGLAVCVGVVLVLALLASIGFALRRDTSRDLKLLLLWMVVPILGLSAIRPIVQPHYVLVAYPVPFLLIGAWAGHFLKTRGRSISVLTGLLATVICVSHITMLAGWYRYVDDDRTDGAGHYELSYRQRREAVMSVLEDSTGKWVQLAGPYSGYFPAYDAIYDYEQVAGGFGELPDDPLQRYWLELDPVSETEMSPTDQASDKRAEKVAFINHIMSEYGRTPPGWEIEKDWRVGFTHIYRIRLDPTRRLPR